MNRSLTVRELLEDLVEGKLAARGKPTKVAPRNLKALLSKIFDWASDRGILAGNPAAGVKLPDRVREHLKRGGKDRVLSDEEIATLWGGASRCAGATSGMAPGGSCRPRWPRTAEPNRVYLSLQARAILDDLRPATGGSAWVLESPREPGLHLTTVKTAYQGILERSGMRPWSPHDLRRTAASKMSAMGVDRRVIQGILNHKDRSVTSVYDRYGLGPEKRAALTEWGRRVETITGGEPEGRVVEFRVRGEAGRTVR